MALFGRKKSENSDVPADLQQYYSSDKPSIMTWIIRGVIFLVVLALLVWFGFWLFNKLAGSDEASRTGSNSNTNQQQNTGRQGNGSPAPTPATPTPTPPTPAPANTPAPTPAPAATPAPSARPQPTPAPATVTPTPAQTGGQGGGAPSGSTLPNSGPGTVLAAIFAGASALGAIVHAFFVRRRAARS